MQSADITIATPIRQQIHRETISGPRTYHIAKRTGPIHLAATCILLIPGYNHLLKGLQITAIQHQKQPPLITVQDPNSINSLLSAAQASSDHPNPAQPPEKSISFTTSQLPYWFKHFPELPHIIKQAIRLIKEYPTLYAANHATWSTIAYSANQPQYIRETEHPSNIPYTHQICDHRMNNINHAQMHIPVSVAYIP